MQTKFCLPSNPFVLRERHLEYKLVREKLEQYPSLYPIWWNMHKNDIIIGVIYGILHGLCNSLGRPYIINRLITYMYDTSNEDEPYILVSYLFALLICESIFQLLSQQYLVARCKRTIYFSSIQLLTEKNEALSRKGPNNRWPTNNRGYKNDR